jgi:hypothetical protein
VARRNGPVGARALVPSDADHTGVTPEWKTLYEQYTAAGIPSGAAIPGEALE